MGLIGLSIEFVKYLLPPQSMGKAWERGVLPMWVSTAHARDWVNPEVEIGFLYRRSSIARVNQLPF
jgi:hypothetical protein